MQSQRRPYLPLEMPQEIERTEYFGISKIYLELCFVMHNVTNLNFHGKLESVLLRTVIFRYEENTFNELNVQYRG